MIVDAHKKANMDEHWAVWRSRERNAGHHLPFPVCAQVSGGGRCASGPMHAAAGYRDAVGDSGRRQMNEMTHNPSR
jgi:hypothetical protein